LSAVATFGRLSSSRTRWGLGEREREKKDREESQPETRGRD
jgi:hypothetical protein